MGVRKVGGRVNRVRKKWEELLLFEEYWVRSVFLMEFSPVEGELSFLNCTVTSAEINRVLLWKGPFSFSFKDLL